MIGFIRKDFIALKKYIKQFILMGGFFAVFAVILKSPEYMVFMFLIFGSMSVISSISLDENVNWNKYAFAMPVNKREVILAKYITWLMLNCISFFVAAVMGMGLALYMKKDIQGFILETIAVDCVYLIGFSILIPFLYKLGVEKGRMIMLGIFIIPTIIVILGRKFISEMPFHMEEQLINKLLIIGLPITTIAAVIISFFVSVSIIHKKEW